MENINSLQVCGQQAQVLLEISSGHRAFPSPAHERPGTLGNPPAHNSPALGTSDGWGTATTRGDFYSGETITLITITDHDGVEAGPRKICGETHVSDLI